MYLGLVINVEDREAMRKIGEETLALARSALAMDIQVSPLAYC